jgi:hypothetical protein
MATLRLLTLLTLTVFCSTILAQNKPCEPCDTSKCPMVILEIVFYFFQHKRYWIIFIDLGQGMSCRINTWSLWLLSSLCSTRGLSNDLSTKNHLLIFILSLEWTMQSSRCPIEQTIWSMWRKSSMQVSDRRKWFKNFFDCWIIIFL